MDSAEVVPLADDTGPFTGPALVVRGEFESAVDDSPRPIADQPRNPHRSYLRDACRCRA